MRRTISIIDKRLEELRLATWNYSMMSPSDVILFLKIMGLYKPWLIIAKGKQNIFDTKSLTKNKTRGFMDYISATLGYVNEANRDLYVYVNMICDSLSSVSKLSDIRSLIINSGIAK